MKLRLQSNSLRLRLKQGEVQSLVRDGSLQETIVFAPGAKGEFHFLLEASEAVNAPQASLQEGGIIVRVPAKVIGAWASSNEVGIETFQAAGEDTSLRILIEKDFACIDGPAEDNVDTFPNPLAEVKADA